jgi:XTP/dITP diphosphohydrolase
LHCKLPAIADDSGLVVDALNGAPGVYSARYAGIGASDNENTQKLLHALENVPEELRTARFICVMVFMAHADDPLPIITQGSWEGRILTQAVGNNGFGYDPVFFVPDYQCASAELLPEIKNSLSHRGIALKKLTDTIKAME